MVPPETPPSIRGMILLAPVRPAAAPSRYMTCHGQLSSEFWGHIPIFDSPKHERVGKTEKRQNFSHVIGSVKSFEYNIISKRRIGLQGLDAFVFSDALRLCALTTLWIVLGPCLVLWDKAEALAEFLPGLLRQQPYTTEVWVLLFKLLPRNFLSSLFNVESLDRGCRCACCVM